MGLELGVKSSVYMERGGLWRRYFSRYQGVVFIPTFYNWLVWQRITICHHE